VIARSADLDALFAQVVGAPDDDAARRVLADRLQELGDPHGEYIQLACDAEALPRRDPRRAALDARALELRSRHSLAFSRALRSVPFFNRSGPAGSVPFQFARGFPEKVRGPSQRFLSALKLAARVSPIRAVTLVDARAADVRRLASMPVLARIRELNLQSRDENLDGALLDLLASPHLDRLERLELHCMLTRADLEALGRCPAVLGAGGLQALVINPPASLDPKLRLEGLLRGEACATLRSLRFCGVKVDASAIVELGALEQLSLTSCQLGGASAARVLAARAPSPLRALEIGNSDVGELSGLSELASSRALAGLERLSLYGVLERGSLAAFLRELDLPALESLSVPMSPEGARSFAEVAAKQLPMLRDLDISGAHIKDDGAKALASLEHKSLERLDLDGNAIGPAGMEALARGPLLGTVRDLSIRSNKWGSAGLLHLAKAPSIGRLRSLWLRTSRMDSAALRALLEAAHQLETLEASSNLGAEASRILAASTSMRRLHTLTLRDADVRTFAGGLTAERIRQLTLESSAIDEDAARALAALPNLESLHLHFPIVFGEARAALCARYGPNLTVTTHHRNLSDWHRLPGPP
jgi:uncharacterized protein (TIGR02996 family)